VAPTSPYTTTLAPIAAAQIDAALLWWSRNRPAARTLLAGELEAALGTIEHVPQVGRQTRSRLFRDVRRLLLRGTHYHLYYQVIEARREVRIVYFRHARRRPLSRR
jgi:plasmid stabilization system protein ParE